MKSGTITLILALIIIVVFTSFFIIQNYVFDRNNKVEKILYELDQNVQQENWEQAEIEFNDLNRMWEKGKYLVALNNAEQNFSEMSSAVNKLKGAVAAEDKSSVFQLINQIKDEWKNFKRIVPEP